MIEGLIKKYVKNYKETTNAKVREEYGKFASILGIISNIVLFLAKIIVGLMFNSISITADAINNLSDSASSIVTLVGFKIAGKPADAKHPYGHERIEYVSGLIVSFIIIFLGLQLVKSSIYKIIEHQTPEFSVISVSVLVAAIIIKVWQYHLYRTIGKKINSVSLLATAVDSRNDILATSGVLIATIGTHLTGFDLDGYMGIVIALFILISGVKLVGETVNYILGVPPSKEMVDSIYKKILSYDNIIGLHDLNIHSYGATKCFASAHCEVPADQNLIVSHAIVDNIERDLLNDLGIHMVIHLDPIVANDEKTNLLKKEVIKVIKNISPQIGIHDFQVVWGVTTSNIIFDISIPFDMEWSPDELKTMIAKKVNQINESYYAIITVDYSHYVPSNDAIKGK